MPGKGLFITVEGGEGVGKTTLMTMLDQYFSKTMYRYVRTREPGGTPEAEAIRGMILNPKFEKPPEYQRGFMTEIFLFCAARADHVQRLIQPAINDGQIVLCDRYYDSTMAYQVAAAPPEHKESVRTVIRELNSLKYGIIRPDITFLLVAPDDVLATRLNQRSGGKLDFIEQRTQEYHAEVRNNYIQCAKDDPDRFAIINANRPRREILSDVLISIALRGGIPRDNAALEAIPQ